MWNPRNTSGSFRYWTFARTGASLNVRIQNVLQRHLAQARWAPQAPFAQAYITAWQSQGTALLAGASQLIRMWSGRAARRLQVPAEFTKSSGFYPSDVCGWEGGMLPHSFVHTYACKRAWGDDCARIRQILAIISEVFQKGKFSWRELRKWTVSSCFLCFQNL